MHRSIITPPEIEAKAYEVLKLLDGLTFFQASYALDSAGALLDRERSRLSEQLFSFSLDCSPKGGGDRL